MNGESHRSYAIIADIGDRSEADRVIPEPVAAARVNLIYSLMRTQRMVSSQLSRAFNPFGFSWAGYKIMQLLVRFDRNPI
ncbi:hypothetical protein [Rhodococcus koreensis]